MKLNSKNYIAVADWMMQLGLSSKELLAYAIIYGFSQDGESKFHGSLSYMAAWLKMNDRANVLRVLNSLVKKGMITKDSKVSSTKKWCEYSVIDRNFTSESYVIIYPWMIEELDLKDRELLIYAIIYGYSKASTDSYFVGSMSYLGKWLNISPNHISERYVKPLIDKGLIIKDESKKSIRYRTISQNDNTLPNLGGSQNDNTLSQNNNTTSQNDNGYLPKMTTNNISNNISDNISIESDSQKENASKSKEENIPCVDYFSLACTKTEDEILTSLNNEQTKALNKLIVLANTNKIDATKESLIRYFGLLQARDWKDQYGKKIKNIVGYIQSNFSLHSKEKDYAINKLKEEGWI